MWSSKDRNYRQNIILLLLLYSSFACALCYYYFTTRWLSLHARTYRYIHPALQPFYLGYLLENYRVDRCSARRERGKTSCTPTTRWFCFFQGWARGHMYKGAKPELGEFRHHLLISNRTVHWLSAAVNLILSCWPAYNLILIIIISFINYRIKLTIIVNRCETKEGSK